MKATCSLPQALTPVYCCQAVTCMGPVHLQRAHLDINACCMMNGGELLNCFFCGYVKQMFLHGCLLACHAASKTF